MPDDSTQPEASPVEKEITSALDKFRRSLALAKKEFTDEITRLLREEDNLKIKSILENLKNS